MSSLPGFTAPQDCYFTPNPDAPQYSGPLTEVNRKQEFNGGGKRGQYLERDAGQVQE